VYEDIEKFSGVSNPVVTIGTFDGVHLGHRKLIAQLQKSAEKQKGGSVVLTFHPHPRIVLYPDDHGLKLLNTLEEKIELLEQSGVDHLIISPFTKKFSRLSAVEFVRNILVGKIRTKKLIIGYNHHFGRNREGTLEQLRELSSVYGFAVEEIPPHDVENIEVSSTKIRESLTKGDIPRANRFLGYEYSLRGTVVKGKEVGKSLGFPTANLEVGEKNKLIPRDGVYAVRVMHEDKIYKGMMSIGMNPTMNGTERTLEVNIFDFDKEVYGERMAVFFRQRIRDEIKFSSAEELKKEMENDTKKTFEILS
jgi:riboflavin kinase/FMN adenylyltransferase